MYCILVAIWSFLFLKDMCKLVIYPIYYTKKYKIRHNDILACFIDDKKINNIDTLHLNILFIDLLPISFASISAIKK